MATPRERNQAQKINELRASIASLKAERDEMVRRTLEEMNSTLASNPVLMSARIATLEVERNQLRALLIEAKDNLPPGVTKEKVVHFLDRT